MKTKIIIDGFSNIDLSQYPNFLDQAKRAGLNSLLDAILVCEQMAREYGQQGHLLIRITPNAFPQIERKLLAHFIIHLAYSQHDQFTVPDGFWLWFPRYRKYVRRYTANDHFEWAEIFYKTLDMVNK